MELLGRLEVGKGYVGTGPHKHHFFEVFYISRGRFDVNFENTTENLSRGDLLVRVDVWVPKSFTKEEKKLLDELSKLDTFKPKPNAKEKSFFEKMKNMFS